MIVSWNWLQDYVPLDLPVEQLAERLMFAGFNLESIAEPAGDFALDLEITSNRPDCLGHLGVAREIAALLAVPLRRPPHAAAESSPPLAGRFALERADSAAGWCPQYTARLVEGVRVGPSPEWLARRLRAIGAPVVNNIVDATNYVMFECGQPLHAFDFAKLRGGKIVVRNARAGEKFAAINHKDYVLAADHAAICDAERPVALAGVMGGAETEIAASTTAVLVEAAEFAPLAVRKTSRALDLLSDSSYRFERRIDPHGVQWAQDRACRLILELAGGKLAAGTVRVGEPPPPPAPIRLRWSRTPRILGIAIPQAEQQATLTALGVGLAKSDADGVDATPPSWRRDLTREIDLVEEIGRIHGYGDVPENATVPLVAAPRSQAERVLEVVRTALVGFGYCETVAFSAVDPAMVERIRPWSDAPPLTVRHSKFRHANALRQSTLPSLLAGLRQNEARGVPAAKLCEIARVFPPAGTGLPAEHRVIGLAVHADDDKDGTAWRKLRGEVEALLSRLRIASEVVPAAVPGLSAESSAEIRCGGARIGVLGHADAAARTAVELRGHALLAELLAEPLIAAADLLARGAAPPSQPASERDLAVVFDEATRWADVERLVRAEAGPQLETLEFVDLYRGKQIPAGKKSLFFRLTYRAPDRTLTREEVDARQQRIAAALADRLGGALRT